MDGGLSFQKELCYEKPHLLSHLVTCLWKARLKGKVEMDINAWGAALTTSLATALGLFLGAIP
ncbi:MAG: hypothetical protein ABIU06_02225, partial [Anaerolineales bacterium]